MAFGLGELRLAPRDFWAMTPRELAAAADALGATGEQRLSRAELSDLMSTYPDEGVDDG